MILALGIYLAVGLIYSLVCYREFQREFSADIDFQKVPALVRNSIWFSFSTLVSPAIMVVGFFIAIKRVVCR